VAEDPSVVAVAKEAPAAAELAIHAAREPNAEPLEAARERQPVARLGDEVDVVALHAEGDDAKVPALRTDVALLLARAHRGLDGGVAPARAKVGNAAHHAPGDV